MNNGPPEYVHIRIPRAYEYVISRGKQGFADVMLKILRWGGYPELSEWVRYNHKCPYKREAVSQSQRRRYDDKSRSWTNVEPGAKECRGL